MICYMNKSMNESTECKTLKHMLWKEMKVDHKKKKRKEKKEEEKKRKRREK